MLIAYFDFPPFVVTLGMLSIARSLAMVLSNNTVVFQFGPDHDRLLALGGGSTFGHRQSGALHARAGAAHRLRAALDAVRALRLRDRRQREGGELTGVPVRGIKVAVYMISSLSAGIAGIIQTGWLGAVTTNLGAGLELQVIAAAVIGGANLAGGIGTAFGALVGAALIEIIRNSLGLLGINAFWQGTFIGGFIVIAVASTGCAGRAELQRIGGAAAAVPGRMPASDARSGRMVRRFGLDGRSRRATFRLRLCAGSRRWRVGTGTGLRSRAPAGGAHAPAAA